MDALLHPGHWSALGNAIVDEDRLRWPEYKVATAPSVYAVEDAFGCRNRAATRRMSPRCLIGLSWLRSECSTLSRHCTELKSGDPSTTSCAPDSIVLEPFAVLGDRTTSQAHVSDMRTWRPTISGRSTCSAMPPVN